MFTINSRAPDYCSDTANGPWISSYPKLLSWNKSTDCCSWDGVYCDETTGQVIELNLTCSKLQGKIHSNSSLFQLYYLKMLDLSYNDLFGSHISANFGGFSSLTHLDLSYSGFTGQIPSEISRLSKLYILSISNDGLRLGPQSFKLLLKNLTQLRVLELNYVNISSTIPLYLSSYLTNLQLENTQLRGILPKRVFHLSNLKSLHFSVNPQLAVKFPITKWNSSTSLMHLYLSGVNATGKIPQSFRYLTSLVDLDISSSNLSGPILKSLWTLTNIETLFLDNNNLEGTIPKFLDGQLELSEISSNVSGLQNLQSLDLSSNYLNGTISSWIFSLPSLGTLDLRNNHFSGKIQEFKSKTQSLNILRLSQNNISGQISSTICNLTMLIVLDLGSNNCNETIPQCLGMMSVVLLLDLSNNSLSGASITTFSIGNQFRAIKLNGNKLEGKVPRSLINCIGLELLDLGNNELSDTFPLWLGTLPNLKILSLRSNKLHGPVKASRNRNFFAQLLFMDLSSNALSGNLPPSLFKYFQAMKTIDETMRTQRYIGEGYIRVFGYDLSLLITTKGLDLEFSRVLTANIIINLSNNRFEGYIPSIIGDLIALRTLNLSHNGLEGHIPASLRHLSVLESLDLSFNKIGGGIPRQLATLTSLAVLNLSHNHLVGCISKGNQFDTFENSSYQGNDGLHGFPLSRDCGGADGVTQATTPFELDQGEEGDSTMISWEAVLMCYGCGLVIVLSAIYIMLSTQTPIWFSRMVEDLEHTIATSMKKHKENKLV